MPFTQAQAAKIFLFFLEPQPLFLDNVMRRPTRPCVARHPASDWARTIMDALNPESGLKPEADPEPGLDRRTRRNLLLLTCCQAVGQSCNTMMFAATGLSVITFYHHPEFANLPVTMQHLGVMIWVFPAALLMQRIGRSIGFRVGSLFGMAGATVMCIGLYTANFLVMCGGGLDPRLRGGLPADVPLRRGGTGADPIPRQGDFMGHRRRRRRRRDRAQPRARDARSDDAALRCDLCRHPGACTSSSSRSCRSSASLGRAGGFDPEPGRQRRAAASAAG